MKKGQQQPHHIEITTNVGCSNLCDHCPQSSITHAYGPHLGERMMSLDTFKSCLDKLPASTIIDFSGMSEPWLNPNCTSMLLYAHEKGHPISVYTTLVGWTERDLNLVQHIAFQEFVVHLAAADGADKIKTGPVYYELLKSVIKSIPNVHFVHLSAVPDPRALAIVGSAEHKPLTTRGNLVPEKVLKPVGRYTGTITCVRSKGYTVLLPNGEVTLCCMDYGLKHKLGNLKQQDYPSLYESQEYKKILRGLEDPSEDILCRVCDWGIAQSEAKKREAQHSRWDFTYRRWRAFAVSVLRPLALRLASIKQWQVNVLNVHNLGSSRALGDTLLADMFCRSIKKKYPGARINLVSNDEDLVRKSPWVHSFNGNARGQRGLSKLLTLEFKYSFLPFRPEDMPIKEPFDRYGLAFEQRPQIHLDREEIEAATTLIPHNGLPTIAINVESFRPVKNWPLAYWEKFVQMIQKSNNVIQLGSEFEPILNGVIRLSGKLSPRQSVAVLANCEAFVGPDSFLMHAARAVNVPSVIIFGGRATPRNFGYPENRNLFVKVECGPCVKQGACEFNTRCMELISVETVYQHATELIATACTKKIKLLSAA